MATPEPNGLERWLSSPFIVGALGAVVALRGAPGDTWIERAFNVLCGSLMAGFMAPAAAEWFALTTPAMHGFMAFFVGLFGMNLTAAVTVLIRDTKLSDLLPWRKGGN